VSKVKQEKFDKFAIFMLIAVGIVGAIAMLWAIVLGIHWLWKHALF
jgi:hypothetical protein